MIPYFFAMLTLIASIPLIWISGTVMLSLLDDLIRARPLHGDDRIYGLATLALWVVVGYADYHALQLLFGGAA